MKKIPVVIRLNGGLGNQMFQYAFGRAIAEIRKAPLILNCYGFKYKISGVTQRTYALDSFTLADSVMVSYEPYNFNLNRFARFVPFMDRMLSVCFEKNISYDTKAYNDMHSSVFVGYWQSYRYFESVSEILLKDFNFRGKFCSSFIDYEKDIKLNQSVMLHVRRGDYVSLASASSYHGVLNIDYYKLAASEVLSREPKACFFVFSNDIDWCRQTLKFLPENTRYIEPDPCRCDVQELILMSLCKYQIIANSSFSWWSAWLSNSNQNKYEAKIIAPNSWFVNQKIENFNRFPSYWIIL
jgi:hypothetical protein